MDRWKTAFILVALSMVLLFNLFQITPPFAPTMPTLDISFGQSQSRPYLLRVKVERITVTNNIQSQAVPVPRMVVKLDRKIGFTDSHGYAFFTVLPGKHLVTISSPYSLLPTYSVDIVVEAPVTELRVRYLEFRLKIASVNVSVDTATSSSAVLVTFEAPPNATIYVGRPYLTYLDFKQYIKIFTGDGVSAYLRNIEIPYQGPFTYMATPETAELFTAYALVPDMIQVVEIEESYVPVYMVEKEVLKMMWP